MSEVSALEKQRENAQEQIARRDMALRLAENPDFKKLVLQEFCVEECARYAQVSGDFAVGAEQRAAALAIAQAAGHLRRWFQVIGTMGNSAEAQMERLDAELEAARQEEVGQ